MFVPPLHHITLPHLSRNTEQHFHQSIASIISSNQDLASYIQHPVTLPSFSSCPLFASVPLDSSCGSLNSHKWWDHAAAPFHPPHRLSITIEYLQPTTLPPPPTRPHYFLARAYERPPCISVKRGLVVLLTSLTNAVYRPEAPILPRLLVRNR